jgi:hypothetical protein
MDAYQAQMMERVGDGILAVAEMEVNEDSIFQ